MTRIVIYAHRYKRPPRKRKAVAVEVPPVVIAKGSSSRPAPEAARPEASQPAAKAKPTVVSVNRKRLKLLRAERWLAEPREPGPEVEAFLARNVRPGGPLPPPRKP